MSGKKWMKWALLAALVVTGGCHWCDKYCSERTAASPGCCCPCQQPCCPTGTVAGAPPVPVTGWNQPAPVAVQASRLRVDDCGPSMDFNLCGSDRAYSITTVRNSACAAGPHHKPTPVTPLAARDRSLCVSRASVAPGSRPRLFLTGGPLRTRRRNGDGDEMAQHGSTFDRR